ncbi:MAG: hypothetical protein BJ554DRAFT_2689 [Olpidium bornovanus]|uniref:Uncharacterized protein n=1 Tax=Olpidium bornovanus TaxID=278681 RepID=A0A8H7ZPX9_9FUNG|nr:MAG: hypothetical protein BJ554DRAFT_2689 [Olpidium bornovanus]
MMGLSIIVGVTANWWGEARLASGVGRAKELASKTPQASHVRPDSVETAHGG